MDFRLLVSDIDGTLVSTDNHLNRETIHSIQAFRQAGGLFTLATGRNFLHTKELIEQLQIDIPVIVSDGAIMYDPIEKKKHILARFSWGQVQTLIQDCQPLSSYIDIFFFSFHPEKDDHRIYSTIDSPMMAQYAKNWFYDVSLLPSWKALEMEAPMINLFVHIKNDKGKEAFREWCLEQTDNYDIQFWTEEFISISPSASNKGSALLTICKQLDVSSGKVAAIGDHYNDLSLSRTVGLFAAMANGEQKVKESAKYVVPSNDDNGVAYFIHHHLLSHTDQS